MFELCKEAFSGNFSLEAALSECPYVGTIAGGAVGAIIAIGVFMILLFIAGLYIYRSFAWMAIAKKLKFDKAWLAWIPIANIAMVLHLGRIHWAWIFLIFIPILGWMALFVLFVISMWKVFEKAKQPGFYSLGIIIPEIGAVLYLIAIGVVAWSGKKVKKKVKK